MSYFKPPFKKRRDGSVSVLLDENQRGALDQIVSQVNEIVADGNGMTWRLSPPTFGDPADQAEYQLDISRGYHDPTDSNTALLQSTATLIRESTSLSEVESELLLAGLNKVRLVLGTICEVEDDGGIADPKDDYKITVYSYYQFATAILASLLDAITS